MINPLVSVIIINHNRERELKECLYSVYDQTYENKEVIVVDNGSEDNSVGMVRSTFPSVHCISLPSNLGVCIPTNRAVDSSRGDYILLLDNDATLSRPSFINRWVVAMEKVPEAGAVCAKVTTPQPEYIMDVKEPDMYAGMYGSDDLSRVQCVGVLNSTAAMIKRNVWDILGGENEDYFAYYNDTDLGTRIVKAGYWVVYDPWNIVYHKSENPIHNETKLYYMIRNHYLYCLEHLPWKLAMMNCIKWIGWTVLNTWKRPRLMLTLCAHISISLPSVLRRRDPTNDPYVIQAWNRLLR